MTAGALVLLTGGADTVGNRHAKTIEPGSGIHEGAAAAVDIMPMRSDRLGRLGGNGDAGNDEQEKGAHKVLINVSQDAQQGKLCCYCIFTRLSKFVVTAHGEDPSLRHPPMATSTQQIIELLEQEKLKHGVSDQGDFVMVDFKTRSYRNSRGENSLRIIISPEENGEFVKFFVPRAYLCPKGMTSYNRLSLFQVLLHISWMTKMLQFEFDPDDGEIRMMIEFPLEDAALTRRQVARCVSTLFNAAEKFHENIVDALEHGITIESESETQKLFEEFMRARREQRRQGLSEES